MKQAPKADLDPVVEAYKKDVDRTLIRENLKLSVEDRFLKAMALMRFAEEMRRAGREAWLDLNSVSDTSTPPRKTTTPQISRIRELRSLTPNNTGVEVSNTEQSDAEQKGSERESPYKLHVSGLCYCSVPTAKLGAGRRVVIERNTIAEGLTVAREVVVVEDVERLGAEFEIDLLFDGEFPFDGNVGVAIRRTAHAADARASAQIIAV